MNEAVNSLSPCDLSLNSANKPVYFDQFRSYRAEGETEPTIGIADGNRENKSQLVPYDRKKQLS